MSNSSEAIEIPLIGDIEEALEHPTLHYNWNKYVRRYRMIEARER